MMGHQIRELCDTELHEAVRFADFADVRDALLNKNDPNQIGLYQWAPMHEAAHNGELEILQLLLKHGGNPNVQDKLNGRTPLHYAAEEGHFDCLSLLLEHGSDCLIEDTHGHTAFDITDQQCQRILKMKGESISHCGGGAITDEAAQGTRCVDDGSYLDVDRCSIASSCSTQGSPATPDPSHTPDLGQIELSFEYDSRKSSLRVRVWQISDIILPPAHTSMISCIYVKSYLKPDGAHESKRKTEEVKVLNSTDYSTTSDNTHTTFLPVTFRFSKSLDYSSVTKDIVRDKTVQLEVCVMQKYTRKSFLISMYRLPCKVAVRQLVRKKYKLIPCSNPTIPDNMKVYSASQFPHSSRNAEMRCLSSVSLNSESSGYPESNTVLEGVTVQRADNLKIPNIVISMPAEENETLFDVTSLDSGLADIHGSQYTSISMENHDSSTPAEITVDTAAKSVSSCYVGNTWVRSEKSDDSDSLPLVSSKGRNRSGFYPVAKMCSKYEGSSKSPRIHLTKVNKVLEEHVPQTDLPESRPDTPTWDEYDLDSDNVRLSVQSVDTFTDSDSLSGSLLPLPTRLDIPCKERSFSVNIDQTADDMDSAVTSDVPSYADNQRTKHSAISLLGKGQDKGKRLVSKCGKSTKKKSSCERPPSRPILQSFSVDEKMRSRELNHMKIKSVSCRFNLTEDRNKVLSTSCENTILDIETDDNIQDLPQSVRNFTIPMQVLIIEDID
ncbi:uncharacterized protein LOC135475341 [Liolophura sinensis]|uniref:uncharacterized protein LOC135475341 n=1 Tax=Liolophura sinensis TaxID=3198878 RepID=UPI003158DA0C